MKWGTWRSGQRDEVSLTGSEANESKKSFEMNCPLEGTEQLFFCVREERESDGDVMVKEEEVVVDARVGGCAEQCWRWLTIERPMRRLEQTRRRKRRSLSRRRRWWTGSEGWSRRVEFGEERVAGDLIRLIQKRMSAPRRRRVISDRKWRTNQQKKKKKRKKKKKKKRRRKKKKKRKRADDDQKEESEWVKLRWGAAEAEANRELSQAADGRPFVQKQKRPTTLDLQDNPEMAPLSLSLSLFIHRSAASRNKIKVRQGQKNKSAASHMQRDDQTNKGEEVEVTWGVRTVSINQLSHVCHTLRPWPSFELCLQKVKTKSVNGFPWILERKLWSACEPLITSTNA
jgi:hypothetical protein